jgi:pimeloyl-ACP methyl ester carboxylesterase
MIHQINAITQKVFFPNTKIKPNLKWEEAFSEVGSSRKVKVDRDGFSKSAVHVSISASSKGIVIFGHPISKKAKYFFTENIRAKIYKNLGYDIVAFDFNGFGELDRIDLRYWKDAQAVVNHFKKSYSDIPFVLHGVSFGAFHILRAYSDLPKESIVVLENMSRSLYDYWKRWFHTRLLVRVFEKLPIVAFQEMEVIKQLQNWKRADNKVIAIASEDDSFTPLGEMEDAISYLKNQNEFVVLPKATHLLGPQQQCALYERTLVNAIRSKRGVS